MTGKFRGITSLAFSLIAITATGAAQPTSVSFVATPTVMNYGQAVQLTASIVPAPAGGSVTFYQGPAILGVSPVVGGNASLQIVLPLPGTRTLKAYYSGHSSYSPSTSSTVSVTVNGVPGDGFLAGTVYPTDNHTVAVAITDLNGDGYLDMITADSEYNGTVNVLLGNGNGTFQPKVTYPASYYPSHVLVSDFNRDGKQDVVMGNAAGTPVGIMLGNGAGQLGPRYDIAMSSSYSMGVGDFNGDGKADLVGVDPAGGIVNLVLGNGDGTFSPNVVYATAAGPYCLTIADLNGDGFSDLAVAAKTANRMSILLGNGTGTFAPAVNYPLGTGQQNNNGSLGTVIADDFNRDGKLDLLASDIAVGIVNLLLGNGDGTFQPRTTFPTGPYPIQVRQTDLNGDGFLDLIALNGDPNAFSTLLGNGDGTFQARTEYPSPVQTGYAINLADFNRDGVPDVVIGAYFSNLAVMLGKVAPGTPDLTLTKSHAGNFVQAQQGATYTIVASNIGTAATSGAVTVTESAPAGMTLVSLAGAGWNCAGNSCTRSDALAAGATYSPITATVNISPTAPSPLVNVAGVSGGGQTNTSNDAASDSTIILPKDQVTVRLLDSAGNPLSGGVVEYFSGSWKPFGTTDATGQAMLAISPATYPFAVTYAGTRRQLSQNVGANPVVTFQTIAVTLQLKDSAGNPLDTGTAQYYGGAWLSFGQTSGGQVRKELFAGTYSFRMTYASSQMQATQDVAANPIVVFQTRAVTVTLKNSTGAALDTGVVQYYAGAWLPFGSTSGGQVQKDLSPGTYQFRITYAGTQAQISQDVGANPIVAFQTQAFTVQLRNSFDNPLDSGTIQYYAGAWLNFGQTVGGQAVKELLSGTYSFAMKYAGGQQTLQNVGANPLLVFQTGRVHSATGTCTLYYAGAWKPFVNDMELLPGSYPFRFNDGTPDTTSAVTAATVNGIH